MTVETATKISQLNALGPPGSDPRSEGDNHLRLIKSCLQAVFDDSDGTAPVRAQMLFKALGLTLAASPTLATDIALYGQTTNGCRDFAFTTAGTWTKPADLKFLDVILVGGGGGSAPVQTTGPGNAMATGGGGAGAVIDARYKASDLPATVAYTVGAAGVGGTAPGGAGGNTTFKGLTAGGGAGGLTSQAPSSGFGQSGSAAGGVAASTETGIRQVLTSGGNGGVASYNFGLANSGWSGEGGTNRYVPVVRTAVSLGSVNGSPGVGIGGGGSGASSGINLAAHGGAAGAAGILYLTEWY